MYIIGSPLVEREEKIQELVSKNYLDPYKETLPQRTPPCLGHIHCRAGSFVIGSEAECSTARATQGR
jgi:hypothetical protein